MAVVYYPKQSIILKRDTTSASFEQVVLSTSPNTILYFGSSSLSEISSSFFEITTSFSLNSLTSSYSLSASYMAGLIESASYVESAERSIFSLSSSYASSSLSASYAPFVETYQENTLSSSYASSSISSSYALTASYALNGGGSDTSLTTGSHYPITSSWAVSASYYPPQSYQANTTSASWASSSNSSSYSIIALNVINGSNSSSYALTASYALNGGGPSITLTTGSTYPVTSSWAVSASYYPPQSYQANTLSSSYASSSLSSSYSLNSTTATNLQLTSYNIYVTFASYSSRSLSSSYASSSLSASYAPFVETYQENTISSSWASSSLSSSYASVALNVINGSNSSSYALTASYALNAGVSGTTLVTGSTYPITSSWSVDSISSSYSITSSYALNGGGGGGGNGYAIVQIASTVNYNPPNNTTFFVGSQWGLTPRQQAPQAHVEIPISGEVKAWGYNIYLNSTGSSEGVDMYLRHNNTTDFGNINIPFNLLYLSGSVTGLSQAVTAGDQIVCKIISPTWTGAPTAIRMSGWILIQTT